MKEKTLGNTAIVAEDEKLRNDIETLRSKLLAAELRAALKWRRC